MIDFKIALIYQMTGLVKSVNFELFIGVSFEYKSLSVLNSRNVRSIDTALNDGIWTQKGFDGTRIDAGQTMVVTVSGTYAKQGILTKHHITKEFHCSSVGEIYY